MSFATTIRWSTIFGVLLASAPFAMAQATDENRIGAATVEWVVANCKVANQQKVGMNVMFVQMIINGSTAEEMASARASARDRVSKYPSKDAACLDHDAKINK